MFLLHYALIHQAVYGDGIGYYAHLHAWVIDHHTDNTNEYLHIYSPKNNNASQPLHTDIVQIVKTDSKGKAQNFYSPGPALLLLPFFLLAHILAGVLHVIGVPIVMNGYSDIYQISTGLGAIVYAMCGLWFLEKILFIFTKHTSTSFAIAVLSWAASSLFYYTTYDVINSHFASFFLVTGCVLFMLKNKKNLISFLLTGFLIGFAGTTRPQDILIGVVWLIVVINELSVAAMLWCFLGAVLGFLPEFLHTTFMYSNLLEHPYFVPVAHSSRSLLSIDWLGSLFHPTTGLFAKAPLFLLGFCGAVWTFLKKKDVRIFALFCFFLTQYMIVSIQGGWFAAAYGGRMYISSTVFFAIGLAELYMLAQKRSMKYLFIAFCSLCVFVNMVSMLHFIIWKT